MQANFGELKKNIESESKNIVNIYAEELKKPHPSADIGNAGFKNLAQVSLQWKESLHDIKNLFQKLEVDDPIMNDTDWVTKKMARAQINVKKLKKSIKAKIQDNVKSGKMDDTEY